MPRTVVICSPVAADPQATGRLSPQPAAVKGTRVGFRVQWDSFDVFMDELEKVLRGQYGVDDVYRWNLLWNIQEEARSRAADPENFVRQADRFAEESDWAILGLAA